MAKAIGVRVYKLTLGQRGSTRDLPFTDGGIRTAPNAYVERFVSKRTLTNTYAEAERSWYFEERESVADVGSRGLVHYGNFGYTSNIKDSKTKTTQYQRKTSDIEEIPLFYEFWFPKKKSYGFALFQSFEGKSCKSMILSKLIEDYADDNPGYTIRTKKLMPTDFSGKEYAKSRVKKLTLYKRGASGEVANRFLGRTPDGEVDLEISISSRRRATIGSLSIIADSVRGRFSGFAEYDGMEFDKATALVDIGGKPRQVGVFGPTSNAGVIDISSDIVRGPNGHPTFESLCEESDKIISDFNDMIS